MFGKYCSVRNKSGIMKGIIIILCKLFLEISWNYLKVEYIIFRCTYMISIGLQLDLRKNINTLYNSIIIYNRLILN